MSSKNLRPIDGDRPITDGYCGVYRPSLSDEKIRQGSRALAKQYTLLPKEPLPHFRPWFSAKQRDKYHLTHQVWKPDQGILCYELPKAAETPGAVVQLRRLGVGISLKDISEINTNKGYWKGDATLQIRISLKETFGLVDPVDNSEFKRMTYPLADILDEVCWNELEAKDGASSGLTSDRQNSFQSGMVETTHGAKEMHFLKGAFGLRFYNLIMNDSTLPFTVAGPSEFTQLKVKDGILCGDWRVSGAFFESDIDISMFPCEKLSWHVIVSVIGWSVGCHYDWSSVRSLDDYEVFAVRGVSKPFSSVGGWPFCLLMNVVPNTGVKGQQFVYVRFVNASVFLVTATTILIATVELSEVPLLYQLGPFLYLGLWMGLVTYYGFLGVRSYLLLTEKAHEKPWYSKPHTTEEAPITKDTLFPGPEWGVIESKEVPEGTQRKSLMELEASEKHQISAMSGQRMSVFRSMTKVRVRRLMWFRSAPLYEDRNHEDKDPPPPRKFGGKKYLSFGARGRSASMNRSFLSGEQEEGKGGHQDPKVGEGLKRESEEKEGGEDPENFAAHLMSEVSFSEHENEQEGSISGGVVPLELDASGLGHNVALQGGRGRG
uniref:Uncharacterized protein n=1 Tax=Chromera velia CCMP2878 TaxID=1169474 RepID=A0A0G4I0F2_9ALVE|eukprot:Cvel_9932.t1-p1 / transcript=Cvel_9932.t1 / gene=Cvel_9932 / organism=Chromera_velia_CCMP2878 / gene_product=hypothetical protein / transcript_product=hypothetical protein / location=Cvel_scaffold587:30883-38452(-) / protein_length=602 / sequence_SO=supercontig / SO=protein_coding / is_pseudo=false